MAGDVMTFTVSPWVVGGVLSLALFGLVFLWRVARDAARDVWEWWRRDRVAPLLEDDDEPLEELPPEQSAEALGFTGEQPSLERELVSQLERQGWFDPDIQARLRGEYETRHSPARERRAPWWEVQHRAAYESLGFDYPSGLMARVRETTL